jgi:mitofilin
VYSSKIDYSFLFIFRLEEEISQLFTPLSKQIDDAVTAAREHISHMKILIDNPNISTSDHETWKKAEHLQEQAKTSYEKVTGALREWKDKLIEYTTATDGKIHPEEKKLDEQYQELHKQYTTSTFVKNFRTYIDEATKSFQKEIETMFPSLAGKNPTQLTQEDLQALLVHAHRRVVKLQNDIARLRINESDSVKAAVDVARADIDRLVEQRVQQRVEKTAEQLTEELKVYERNLRQQFDEQLKHEIVLQHQALTLYLADVLSRQYQEWAKEYEKKLDIESININLNLQNQLRATLDRVHAIEQAIEANYDSQQRGRQAQQLWIQAQNILNQIVHGTTTIANDLDAISKIVPNEKFVQILLNELKNDDLPMTNEEILRERFTHVKKLCRRLALVDNKHNSLWNYFLSYLQSLIIVRQRDDSILIDDAIDLNQLNTFTILNYVQSYLEHNQWYNALRLMQLLTGEPRNVAQSWINDTRNYLAKKQTSELLDAYSNSIGLGTLPKTA